MTRYELTARYDARLSFYGKAHVEERGGIKTLYSYNTKVAQTNKGKAVLFDAWDYSQTTFRHVKEFLKQEGFTVYDKKDMPKHYKIKEAK